MQGDPKSLKNVVPFSEVMQKEEYNNEHYTLVSLGFGMAGFLLRNPACS